LSTASSTLTIPVGTAAGSYFLFAKADGGNTVTETQENNNASGRGVTVGPDLIVSLVSATSLVQAGSAALLTDTITNTGGGDAGPSTTRYYLSKNSILDALDPLLTAVRPIPSLAAGAFSSGSTSVMIPADTVPGLYYVIAKADSDQSVAESSETNNTRTRAVQVQ
jgi:subtilase family serine protease